MNTHSCILPPNDLLFRGSAQAVRSAPKHRPSNSIALSRRMLNISTLMAGPSCQGICRRCISQQRLCCRKTASVHLVLKATVCAGSFYNGNNQPYTTTGAYTTP